MKHVLIVSPHFPPINAPDMQRVRLALPFLRAHDWEATVLALAPEYVEGGVRDPLLLETYPADARVIRVAGIRPETTRRFGFGSLWWRCGRALARAGEKLLREKKFDLVFFSTTQFDSFALGPRWKARFGVPFVIDYQDPWVNDYYARTNTRPPGGWLKFRFGQWCARRQEPRVLREAAGLIAVSDSYAKTLAKNYPWFDGRRMCVIPFGASAADFQVLGQYRPVKPHIDFSDGLFHHVYAGRCGPDMSLSLTVLFRAFKLFLVSHPERAARLRFNFIGTDYAPPPLGREWAMPLARATGVEDYVTENRYRVPYFDALYYLKNAGALLAVGSNDPTYSASKIFPYILAGRPTLLIFHQSSLVLEFARRADVGQRFHFAGPDDVEALIATVHQQWFVEEGFKQLRPFNAAAFAPFTAETLTGRLVEVFDRAAGTAS
jgi:hypothetical protein